MDPISWSFHTHSSYCDGEGSLAEIAAAGRAAGLADLGFSSHAPLSFATNWNMPIDRLAEYAAEIRNLKATYGDAQKLWLGAEIDYIPLATVTNFQHEYIFPIGFDYFVGSVHFLGQDDPPASFDGTEAGFREILENEYEGDIREMTGDYYARLARVHEIPRVGIIGHFDVIKRWNAAKSYFVGDETWYRQQVEEALSAIAESGVLVELNTAGWRKGLGEPYPSAWILERCRDMRIPITVSADSHRPDQLIWGFKQAEELLTRLGVEPVNPANVLSRSRAGSQTGEA